MYSYISYTLRLYSIIIGILIYLWATLIILFVYDKQLSVPILHKNIFL